MKNNNLEALRGLAAILVVTCHIIDKIPEYSISKNHLTNFFANWGTESVIIFFILSGIVIHSSTKNNPRSSKVFLFQRIIRLHPTLILSIFISYIITFFINNNFISIKQILGNLIPISTLNADLCNVLEKNPVVWSLSFEVFFYFVFGILLIGKINNKKIFIWFIISILSIIIYLSNVKISFPILNHLILMFAFSGIWIIGYIIWEIKDRIDIPYQFAFFSLGTLPLVSRLHLSEYYYDPLKFLVFAIFSIPFFCFLIKPNFKVNLNTNLKIIMSGYLFLFIFLGIILLNDVMYKRIIQVLYIAFPFTLMLLMTFLLKFSLFHSIKYSLKKILVYIGSISYGIYLFHFPIIKGCYHLLTIPLHFRVILMLIITILLSYLMEKIFQPYISKFFLTLVKK